MNLSVPAPDESRRETAMMRPFALTVAVVFSLTGLWAWGLIFFSGAARTRGGLVFPPILYLSTLLLLVSSIACHTALAAIRRERQAFCRKNLLIALGAGALFCGCQCQALWTLIANQNPSTVQQDASAFVIVLACLHAMHCCVALLFLCYVTVHAYRGRYDHEYFLGITICAYFWHALGVIWLAILAVFLIALGLESGPV